MLSFTQSLWHVLRTKSCKMVRNPCVCKSLCSCVLYTRIDCRDIRSTECNERKRSPRHTVHIWVEHIWSYIKMGMVFTLSLSLSLSLSQDSLTNEMSTRLTTTTTHSQYLWSIPYMCITYSSFHWKQMKDFITLYSYHSLEYQAKYSDSVHNKTTHLSSLADSQVVFHTLIL